MADQSTKNAERISALIDGQLQEDEFFQTLAELESNSEARLKWDSFHIVGDVMRSGGTPVRVHDAEFLARLRERMSQSPIDLVTSPGFDVATEVQKSVGVESANDGSWRRVAGFASLMLAGVLAWQGLHWANSGNSAAPQLVQLNAPPLVSPSTTVAAVSANSSELKRALIRQDGTSALAMASEPQVMIRDPQLDALLAAHRQLGGASALQMPTGFLRNTTFEEGPR